MSTLIRGDSALWTIPLVDDAGEPYQLHGVTVWVTVKTDSELPDDDALYQHYLSVDTNGDEDVSRGMTLGPEGAASGIVVQELTPTESAAFELGQYVYDVQVMTAEGRIYTLINGEREVVIGDITRTIVPPTQEG